MSIVRRFLIAPSLVRLVRRERGGSHVTEGYFAPRATRVASVRIEGSDCQLVLATIEAGTRAGEERVEVPRAHGDALLDVCAGKATYERTTVALDGRDAAVDRYLTPGRLDLVSVGFDDEAAAGAFVPPAWFGREVSTDAAYERHALAVDGVPAVAEVPVSNAALDAVLDLIEPRHGLRAARPLRAAA